MAKRRKQAGTEGSAGAAAEAARARGGDAAAGRGRARGADAPPEAGPIVPRWLPAVLYVALTLVLFREFVFSDLMLFGADTLSLGYAARAFYAHALKELGTFPLWSPMILGGTPFLEALSGGDSLYPPSVVLLLLTETYRALGWKLVLHVAAAGFFMFGWSRALGSSRAAALVAGTAYMLAPYFVSLVQPGHDGKLFVTALAPLLFWAVERHFVRPRFETFAAIALVVGLVIFTTHFQMAYFLFGAVGAFAVFRTVQIWRVAEPATDGPDAAQATDGPDAVPATDGPDAAPAGAPAGAPDRAAAGRGPHRLAAERLALFLAAAVTGAGIAAVQLLPAVAYVTEHSRRVQTTREASGQTGVDWSNSWSLHPEEALAMVIPEFAGNNAGGADWSQNTYWGRNAGKDNHEGAGLVVLLLAAAAFVGGRRPGLRWYFAGLGSVAFLFALGAHTPLWRIFYEVVPGIRLFRAPSQVMFLFAFSAATLGALGVDRILELGREGKQREGARVLRVMWVAVAALGGLALLASSGALTAAWTAVVYPAADAARLQRLEALTPFIGRGAGIAFLLAAATAGSSWLCRAGYLAPAGLITSLTLLVAVDELRVSTGFIEVLDFEQWAAPDPHVTTILQAQAGDPEPYRLLSYQQVGQDVTPALHGIELAAGHHPNDLNRYRELIGMIGSGVPVNFTPNIRRLLNVRYVVWPDYDPRFPPAPPLPVLSRLQLRSGQPYTTLLAAEGLPRARLVGNAVVRTDAEAVPYMLSEAFHPEREVVLPEPPPIELDGAMAEGSVTWLARGPNRLRLAVTTERPALLVVADNWFPAWHATVDGEEAVVLRAYHTLRAVPVGAGEHTVEMYYSSDLVRRSLWLSVLLFSGLVAALAARAWRRRRTEGPR
jgi:hypothetical protein